MMQIAIIMDSWHSGLLPFALSKKIINKNKNV